MVLTEQLEVDDWVCVELLHLAPFQIPPHLFCILLSPDCANHMHKQLTQSEHIYSAEHFRLIFVLSMCTVDHVQLNIISKSFAVISFDWVSISWLFCGRFFDFFIPIALNLRNVSLFFFVYFDCVLLFVNLSRSRRMDDAEACFILSSRNEVDRMAAVRRTAMNELSAITHYFCQSWTQLLIN